MSVKRQNIDFQTCIMSSGLVVKPWIDRHLFCSYRAPESEGGGEADELAQTVVWKAAAEWKDAKNSGVCLGAYTGL